MWAGQDYLARPGMKETAVISADLVVYALSSAGVSEADTKQLSLLEIGCGPGAVTSHLLPHFSTIHSIDTSPSMLETFAEMHRDSLAPASPSSPSPTDGSQPKPKPRLSYSLHALSKDSANSFPEQFDVAIANAVLHHVDDLEGFMDGVTAVLRSGGWVVFTEFGKEVFGGIKKTTTSGSVNAPAHRHPAFEPAELKDLLEKHGLIDVHTHFKGTLPVFGVGNYEPPCLLVRARKP